MKRIVRATVTLLPIAALVLAGLVAPATADSGDGNSNQKNVVYSSLVAPLPGNLPSLGAEAYAFNELGNAVTFSPGSSRNLTKVVVTMSSWGCAAGSWNLHTCSTPEDSTFSQPITLNIYNPSIDGTNRGAKIVTVTKTFSIKYRPSASALCTGANLGKWYQNSSKTCYNGLAQNITFNMQNVTVPNSAIFGITYNTSHYGYAPIGQTASCYTSSGGCGYDSLNIALSEDPTNVTVGSNTYSGKLWQNSPLGGQYCDGGAAGTGFFRLDSPNTVPCWGAGASASSAPFSTPAIQIYASHGNNDGKEADSGHSDGADNSAVQSGSHSETDHGVKQS